MKKLEISITKAHLQGFTITLGDDGTPNVSASIALLTEGGKKITDYTASTYAWDESKKLVVPPEAFSLLGDAGRLIEASIVKHCRDSQASLGSGEDKPLDLSEIPF